jgi:hypothetical protein
MRTNLLAIAALMISAVAAHGQSDITEQSAAKIVPGHSTKADIRTLLGVPWRVVQFNDCGMAMDDQADETWEYRGTDAGGNYRIHVEFGDDGSVHLVAKIPDSSSGNATLARTAPAAKPSHAMSM